MELRLELGMKHRAVPLPAQHQGFGVVHHALLRHASEVAQCRLQALQHLLQRAEDQGLDGEAFLAAGEVPWARV